MRRSQDHPVSEFTHAGSDTYSFFSIAELLKDVKDNNDGSYVDKDGALNVDLAEIQEAMWIFYFDSA